MKQAIVIGLVLLIAISGVSAFSYKDYYNKVGFQFPGKGVPEIVKENVQEKLLEPTFECEGTLMFTEDLALYGNNSLFIEAVQVFDDGYHVVELTKHEYDGSRWYTVFVNDGKFQWIKKGYCVNGAPVFLYSTTLDVQELKDSDRKTTFGSAVSILSKVKGIDVFQKFKLAGIATKYMFKHSKGPGAPNLPAPGPDEGDAE
jgi:hypothetical protein